ncbi:MAG: 50S ribosomal protein L29 [Chitinivibrionales bacterium]|nr:50S ribosomal protein L29 [Chitinivibrionales bacterium]MBD3396941.1 50S ribosomal protein L29 [Chitinivibrionales bacterium]
MKASQLRDLAPSELKERIAGLEEELFNLRFQQKMGQLSNPLRMRIVKREIAQGKTVLREKKNAAAAGA